MSDWEYSEDDCPKCGSQLAYRRCLSCGGDGCFDDDNDEWGFDTHCDTCNGKGVEEWCQECGWDMNYKCFLSPQYEANWLAKQKEKAQQ